MKKDSSFAEWIQRGAEWIQRSVRQITTEFVKLTIPDMTIGDFRTWAQMNGLEFAQQYDGYFSLQILKGSNVEKYVTEKGETIRYSGDLPFIIPWIRPGSVIFVRYTDGSEKFMRVPKKPEISANQPT